jgi:hypothetical protein
MPCKAHFPGMKGMMRQDEFLPLSGREAVFHQRKIKVFVAAI